MAMKLKINFSRPIQVTLPDLEDAARSSSDHEKDQVLRDLIWDLYQEEIKASLSWQEQETQQQLLNHHLPTLSSEPRVVLGKHESSLPPLSEKNNNNNEQQEDRNNIKLLHTIAQVQRRYLQQEDPKIVFGTLLTGLLELMDSEYGFIGEVKRDDSDGSMYLQSHAITNIAWNAATRKFYKDNVDAGLKFYNMNSLFGNVMVNAKPVISNNPKDDKRRCGIPEGHPPLNCFLGIPFFDHGGEKMNGMVGIANKPGGYTMDDVQFLEPFVVTCSNLIQGYQFMQQNKYLINTLEEKVLERTKELEIVNQNLEEANQEILRTSSAQLEHFAMMSHEIRTPLNCVIGLSSFLQQTELNPLQVDSLRTIVSSGELLSTVVNDVLDYSKLATGHVEINRQLSSLQDTLDVVVRSIQLKASERNLTIVTQYGPTVPETIKTDARRLQQILYNLLGNAIKFAREDGIIELSVELKEVFKQELDSVSETQSASEKTRETPTTDLDSCLDPSTKCPFAKIHKLSKTERQQRNSLKRSCILEFRVKDYGKGISRRDFNKVFQPFRQATRSTEALYGGTGLGLAITSKLIKGLGGTITLDSELGHWTEFTVQFPHEGPCIETSEISDELSDTRILIVCESGDHCGITDDVVDTYKLNVVRLSSCGALEALTVTPGAIDPGRLYICLIDEALYSAESYRQFSLQSRSLLLTFGPRYTVKQTRGHFRSLTEILPSVLLRSFIDYKNSLLKAHSVELKPASSHSVKSVAYGNLRVLIVDDIATNRKVLQRMLHIIGVQDIELASNGREAVDLCERRTFDFVFMDMQMPVMDGLEACKIIVNRRQRNKELLPKVIFVTANVAARFEESAREVGGDGFVSKPFKIERIKSFLQLV